MRKGMIPLLAALMVVVWTSVTIGSQEWETTAKDRFYDKDIRVERDGQGGWAGVRTGIVLRREVADGECELREVSEREIFYSGDQFRLRVQGNMEGYLYVLLHSSSSGETSLLYPYEGEDNFVGRYEARTIPESWFRFDEEAGIERVYLFLSRRRLGRLERLVSGESESLTQQSLERLVASMAGEESQLIRESDVEDGGHVGATYYVERLSGRHDYIVRRFELIHRP